MCLRLLKSVLAALPLVLLCSVAPASAQIVQSVQFGGGGFFPRGIDSRASGDILTRHFFGEPLPGNPNVTDALLFNISDFRSGHVFGEWNVGIGQHIEAGIDVGLYGRTVPTLFTDVVNDQTGNDIVQDLHLRVIPITAIVRFLPFGTAATVQPYVGAGVSAMHFKYTEVGEFIDPNTLDIQPGSSVASGFAPGGVLLGGVRFPLGGDIYGFAVEGRYLFGVGTLGSGFASDKIDLGGGELNFAFLLHF